MMLPLLIALLLFLGYLNANVAYIFLFSLISGFSRPQQKKKNDKQNRFVLLYPAYKGDAVILSSIKEGRNQSYPNALFELLVIADKLKPETIAELKELGAQVVEVNFENSTKSKSLNAGLATLSEKDYDYAVIMDIDNVMHPEFLENLNHGLADNPLIAQAHRVAKNMDTDMAILDALSEEINNSIFRKAHTQVGLSSALIGSGIAMQFLPFKTLMGEVQAIGGFDKEMEVRLLKAKEHIDYIEYALVYDEKVQDAEIFENQRKRWLSAQFHYLRNSFFDSLKALIFKGNIDYFNKVFQFLLLPRVLLLGLTFAVGGIALVLTLVYGFKEGYQNDFITINVRGLISLPLVVLFSLYQATPKYLRKKRTLVALRQIPLTFWVLFRTLFKLKGANKKFIHTPHSDKK